jgi:hypothetical protein
MPPHGFAGGDSVARHQFIVTALFLRVEEISTDGER